SQTWRMKLTDPDIRLMIHALSVLTYYNIQHVNIIFTHLQMRLKTLRAAAGLPNAIDWKAEYKSYRATHQFALTSDMPIPIGEVESDIQTLLGENGRKQLREKMRDDFFAVHELIQMLMALVVRLQKTTKLPSAKCLTYLRTLF